MRLSLPATVLQAQDGGRILKQGAEEEAQEEVDRTTQRMQQLIMAETGKHGKWTRTRPAFLSPPAENDGYRVFAGPSGASLHPGTISDLEFRPPSR